jgi:hypothetical protein
VPQRIVRSGRADLRSVGDWGTAFGPLDSGWDPRMRRGMTEFWVHARVRTADLDRATPVGLPISAWRVDNHAMSTSDSRLKIAMFQYEVARVEANQTRHDQQSIINWNQAFAVALFAAGIIAIKELDDVRVPQLLFGFVLPAVLVGGTMAWAGEMIRMERTAVFLRALERSVWRSTPDDKSESAWFVWENFL